MADSEGRSREQRGRRRRRVFDRQMALNWYSPPNSSKINPENYRIVIKTIKSFFFCCGEYESMKFQKFCNFFVVAVMIFLIGKRDEREREREREKGEGIRRGEEGEEEERRDIYRGKKHISGLYSRIKQNKKNCN